MIETLISSKTRIKLLLKFFLNSDTQSYLRSLANEFSESSNAIRVELNRLEDAGMLVSHTAGNKKLFQANIDHPLYNDIRSILMKYIGIDKIIENVVKRMGEVDCVYLTGSLAKGIDSDIIDIIIIGKVNKSYLVQLIEKVEKMIDRKVRYITYDAVDPSATLDTKFEVKPLLLWKNPK